MQLFGSGRCGFSVSEGLLSQPYLADEISNDHVKKQEFEGHVCGVLCLFGFEGLKGERVCGHSELSQWNPGRRLS